MSSDFSFLEIINFFTGVYYSGPLPMILTCGLHSQSFHKDEQGTSLKIIFIENLYGLNLFEKKVSQNDHWLIFK